MPLVQGDLLHQRYRIADVLGHGGMGSVYRAHDENLDIEVAVKENLFTTEDYARQFRLEANILAGLRHPNLPRVTDHFVLPEEGQYLVMDYIQGLDLRQILEQKGPISQDDAVRIGVAICDALTYLHSRSPVILHRDIKLGNVKVIPGGDICLVDFGLAKLVEGDQPTMTGARAMTPGYSPPEQYGTSRTDARSDIYSLGATLYAAITGYIPEDSLARAIDGLELTPVLKRNPKISENLAAAIEKAMEPAAAQRFQTAEEFKSALLGQEYQSQTPASVRQASKPKALPSAPISQSLSATSKLNPKPQKKSLLRPLFFASIVLVFVLTAWILTSPKIFPAAAPPISPQPTVVPSASPSVSVTETVSTEPATNLPVAPTASATLSASATASNSPVPSTTPQATADATEISAPIPDHGLIVFASVREGLSQIYTINPDGTGESLLFTRADGACQPKWSPDGKKVVFISPCRTRQPEYQDTSLGIYDLETQHFEILPSAIGGDFEPAWSSDGKYIVFTSLRSENGQPPHSQIYKIEAFGKKITTRLTQTDETLPARHPVWSPDGTMIIYSLKRLGFWQLWKMDADGANPEQLLRNGSNRNDFYPVLASDGLSIYFNQTTGSDTMALPRFMRNTFPVTTSSVVTTSPFQDVSVAPDGNLLVGEGTDGANNIDLYLYNLIEKTYTPITNNLEPDFDPDWQP